jgi:hypothetical protein
LHLKPRSTIDDLRSTEITQGNLSSLVEPFPVPLRLQKTSSVETVLSRPSALLPTPNVVMNCANTLPGPRSVAKMTRRNTNHDDMPNNEIIATRYSEEQLPTRIATRPAAFKANGASCSGFVIALTCIGSRWTEIRAVTGHQRRRLTKMWGPKPKRIN